MALTEGFKKFVKIGGVFAVVVGGYFYASRHGLLKKLAPDAQTAQVITPDIFKNAGADPNSPPGKLERPMKVGINAWCGFAGGPYHNHGFKANTAESEFYKNDKLQVEFVHNDNFQAGKEAWRAGQLDAWYCTVDSFPVDAGGLAGDEPVIVLQTDWSRGGDAIVVTHDINTVADLKGKDIACAIGSPSHTLLLWTLSANNMNSNDINIVKTADGIDSANIFKAKNKVQAAVVWAPDDQDCLEHVTGSKVLINSKQASHIIADAIYVKRSFLNAHPDDVKALVKGWLKGNGDINGSAIAKDKAAVILAEGFGSDKGYCLTGIGNARLCTYGDNLNFFAINKAYKGITGQVLYEQMAGVYQKLHLADDKLPAWRNIIDTSSLKSIKLARPSDLPEGQSHFAKLTDEGEGKLEAIATKRVTITFVSGSSALDENAKFIIQDKFGDLAQGFANSRVRVEGNTDNVGNDSVNIPLSKARAESVAQFIATKYGFERNRFVVTGNGASKPVADNNSDEGRRQNRRTDFELVK